MEYSKELLESIPSGARERLMTSPVYFDVTVGKWREWNSYATEWQLHSSKNDVRDSYFTEHFRELGYKKADAQALAMEAVDLLPHLETIPGRANSFLLSLSDIYSSLAIDVGNLENSKVNSMEDYLYQEVECRKLSAAMAEHPILSEEAVEESIYPWFQEYLLSLSGIGGIFIILSRGEKGKDAAEKIYDACVRSVNFGNDQNVVSLASLAKSTRKKGEQCLFVNDLKGGNLPKVIEKGYNSDKSILIKVTEEELAQIDGAPEGVHVLDLGDTAMAEKLPCYLGGGDVFGAESRYIWHRESHLMNRYLLHHLKAEDTINQLRTEALHDRDNYLAQLRASI